MAGEDFTYTPDDILAFFDKEPGYHCKFIYTMVAPGKRTWKASGWKTESAAKTMIYAMYHKKIPHHFAYIKFYKKDKDQGPFALVAGKTNLGNPDFDFSIDGTSKTKRGDKARRHLKNHTYDWEPLEVLVVWKDGQAMGRKDGENQRWGKQSRLALEVESEIKRHFGLFSS